MRTLIRLLATTPQERLDDLIALVSKLRGECESWRVQHDYHNQRVSQIDPHEDWWGFAHHKQKAVDALIEVDAINAKLARYAPQLENMLNQESA